jgi:hypothetical protein
MAGNQNNSTLSQIARNAGLTGVAGGVQSPLSPPMREFVAEVTAADSNGHEVTLVQQDGTLSTQTFQRVHCKPTDDTLAVGSRVMLVFDGQSQQPYIRLAGSGGGGGTTQVLVAGQGLAYFTTG